MKVSGCESADAARVCPGDGEAMASLKFGVRETLRDRAGQNLSEFMVILVFCFGLGGFLMNISGRPGFGTQHTGVDSTALGECVDDDLYGGFYSRNATFDAKTIGLPVLENGVIDPKCDNKQNMPWRVSSMYGNRAAYLNLPFP